MVLLPESRISSHLGLNVIEEKPEDDQSPTEVEQKPADPKVAAATNVGVGIPLLSITGTYYIQKGLDRQKYHRRSYMLSCQNIADFRISKPIILHFSIIH